MKKLYFKRLYLKIGRDKIDPQRAVLPALIFINTNNRAFEEDARAGFLILFGWWDFSISVGYFFKDVTKQ